MISLGEMCGYFFFLLLDAFVFAVLLCCFERLSMADLPFLWIHGFFISCPDRDNASYVHCENLHLNAYSLNDLDGSSSALPLYSLFLLVRLLILLP